ncbi:Gfo/Idh/MocA family protein [Priestia taiwanensis]|uniref:Oxidoreductase YulF n=1 Tax=Priestia taiwanensis TaxID=1347902 RepID=A0A917AXD2_9BACI|nr:Gfo/Idh/MocA family oxidoreductase [Priestia taiwanensis]MBM7364914.1 putative dehydrogenase [Priestia taiwanensis]GGE82582.1 putative oxidoreductase YulF [Priestia taiwanensis]
MVRFGIIGTNKITETLLEAAKTVEGFNLAAVYSRKEETARAFADKYEVEHIYTNIEEMVASDTIDAVYIASPNALHAEQAIVCMEHGKHVLCEKAIASNTAELQKMIDTARKHNVVLMEAMMSTMTPNFKSILDNLSKIGKVRRYFAQFCQYSSRYDKYKQGTVLNAFNPTFSNGSLMDIGIYCVYPMVVLFGEPMAIKANAFMLDSGVDGEGSMLATYEEMEGVLMYSKITNSHLPSEIQGEEGTIVIDHINTPTKIEIRYRDGRVEDITVPQETNIMRYEVEEFISLVQSESQQSSINSHKHSMIVMNLLEESRKQVGLVFPADTNK